MEVLKSFRPYLVSTLILIISGWAGLYLLLNFTEPTLWPRWGFYILVIFACTGTTLPMVYLANTILPTKPPAAPSVITRQALWIGVYCASLLWLSVGRILNFSSGLWLALGFGAVEYFLRTRETFPSNTEDNAAPQPPVS
jgi:hypothetical protein